MEGILLPTQSAPIPQITLADDSSQSLPLSKVIDFANSKSDKCPDPHREPGASNQPQGRWQP